MNTKECQEEIIRLKKEKDICILAHAYQSHDIWEMADYVGDSYGLSLQAKKAPQKNVIMCGVRFMAETVKIVSPEKNIKLLQGGCPTHVRVTVKEVAAAKERHPDAKLLVHPECLSKVSEAADYVGSTTEIMDFAKKSENKEFIIGTENSIVQHLQFACPDKFFYPLSKDCVCHNMKVTTLGDLYNCVKGIGGEEIKLDSETIQKAYNALDAMILYGN